MIEALRKLSSTEPVLIVNINLLTLDFPLLITSYISYVNLYIRDYDIKVMPEHEVIMNFWNYFEIYVMKIDLLPLHGKIDRRCFCYRKVITTGQIVNTKLAKNIVQTNAFSPGGLLRNLRITKTICRISNAAQQNHFAEGKNRIFK